MTYKLTEDSFLKDVAEHQIQIIKEDGVHRHIRFQKPGTMGMHFDFITWPGYLCYTGDMGTFVFSRLDDMFQFFRTDREYAHTKGKQLGINLSYWGEKVQAVDNRYAGEGSISEFDPVRFKQVINEYRVRWMRETKETSNLNKEERRELWEAVEDEVLSEVADGGTFAQQAAYNFSWKAGHGRTEYAFHDFFEHNFTKPTHTFQWCCYALAWGIQQYDSVKAEPETEVPA